MVNVFIDTQVFVDKNFNFNNELFQRLIVAKEDDLISVYLTEIVIKEVESKIYENVYEKVKNSHSKFVKDARILRNIDKYKDIFNISNELEFISNTLIDEFEQFLIDVDAEIISIEAISPTRVFEKYFRAKPPFSHKKKSEFPDAFSLEAILKWFNKEETEVFIVSNDQDLKEFCESIENLRYVPSLESFFDSLTKFDTYNHQFIISVYDANQDTIADEISIHTEKSEFILSDVEGDVLKSYIDHIELDEDPYIIEIGDEIAKIAFNSTISLHADIHYIDYESSPYDKEEGKYLFHHYEETQIEDVVVVPTLMAIKFQYKDKYELEIINISLNEEEYIEINAYDQYPYS